MKISASSRRKRQEVLEEGLGRLHKLLAELLPAQRLTALQFFSESLRSALLRYMELRHLHRSTDAPPGLLRSAQQSKPRKRKATVDAAKTRPNSLKGVSMIKTKDGHPRYFARAIISGIAISSRCVRSREEAQVLRAQLEQVSLLHRGQHDSQLELAFDKFQEHMWHFRATVDARRFLGKTLSSRQVSSIRQALAMKQNLDEARQQGWPVLRASWVQSMQEPRESNRFGHRSLSAQEADAMCREAEAKAESCPRVRLPSKMALAAQLRAERSQRATLARQKQLQRLAIRLERTLKAIRGQAQ